jgi:hypothetical protein
MSLRRELEVDHSAQPMSAARDPLSGSPPTLYIRRRRFPASCPAQFR